MVHIQQSSPLAHLLNLQIRHVPRNYEAYTMNINPLLDWVHVRKSHNEIYVQDPYMCLGNHWPDIWIQLRIIPPDVYFFWAITA
jgi:hypothetical protein